jgi:hypothetical protein
MQSADRVTGGRLFSACFDIRTWIHTCMYTWSKTNHLQSADRVTGGRLFSACFEEVSCREPTLHRADSPKKSPYVCMYARVYACVYVCVCICAESPSIEQTPRRSRPIYVSMCVCAESPSIEQTRRRSRPMYVCVYVCMCVCMYEPTLYRKESPVLFLMYVCACACTCMYIWAAVSNFTLRKFAKKVALNMYVCVCMYVCMYVYIYTCTVHTHSSAYIHTNFQTHFNTLILPFWSKKTTFTWMSRIQKTVEYFF